MDGKAITKETIVDIIKDEVERMRSELGDDLSHCLKMSPNAVELAACIDKTSYMDEIEDRLRPEGEDDQLQLTDKLKAYLGGDKPIKEKKTIKTLAQKARSKNDYKRRMDKERMRKNVFHGPTVMDTLGLTEEDIEEEKKPRRNRKPGKKRKSCGPGNPYKNQDGKFTAPKADRGSWSKKTKGDDCAHGQFKRPHSNKSTQYVKDCGRKGREQGTNILCKTGKPATYQESWSRFLNEANDNQQHGLPSGKSISHNELRGAIKAEVNKLLQNYDKWLSDTQKRAIHNPSKLSDDKLTTYCNSFGWTTWNQYIEKTGAIDTLINNVISSKDVERTYKEPSSQNSSQGDPPPDNPG